MEEISLGQILNFEDVKQTRKRGEECLNIELYLLGKTNTTTDKNQQARRVVFI